MGYIYKITNIVTNKCYIGQTINDPEKRWIDHKKTINTKYGCPALKASMKKHGIEHFKFLLKPSSSFRAQTQAESGAETGPVGKIQSHGAAAGAQSE